MEKVKNKDAEPEESRTDKLDEGLEETFPGSDPVSANQPGKAGDRGAADGVVDIDDE